MRFWSASPRGSIIVASTVSNHAKILLDVLLVVGVIAAIFAVVIGVLLLVNEHMEVVISIICVCGVLLLIGWVFNLGTLMAVSGTVGGLLGGMAIVSQLN